MPRVKLFDENIVLAKAMHLFWKKGYSATSVQDLVDHLGINRASIYDTFGDKDKLFQKAFELYRTTSRAEMVKFLESQPNVKGGILALLGRAIKESISDKECKGCFVVNTTTELVPNDEKMLTILERNREDVENVFYEYFKKGKENGQLETNQDLKSTASLFYTLYSGLRVVCKVNPDRERLSDSLKMATSLLN